MTRPRGQGGLRHPFNRHRQCDERARAHHPTHEDAMTDRSRECRYCPAVLKDYRGRVAHEMAGHPDEYEDDVVDAEVAQDYAEGMAVHEIMRRHRIAGKRMYAIIEAEGVPRRTRPNPKARTRNPPMVKRYPKGGVMPWRELFA